MKFMALIKQKKDLSINYIDFLLVWSFFLIPLSVLADPYVDSYFYRFPDEINHHPQHSFSTIIQHNNKENYISNYQFQENQVLATENFELSDSFDLSDDYATGYYFPEEPHHNSFTQLNSRQEYNKKIPHAFGMNDTRELNFIPIKQRISSHYKKVLYPSDIEERQRFTKNDQSLKIIKNYKNRVDKRGFDQYYQTNRKSIRYIPIPIYRSVTLVDDRLGNNFREIEQNILNKNVLNQQQFNKKLHVNDSVNDHYNYPNVLKSGFFMSDNFQP
jgi:hypothetical protein